MNRTMFLEIIMSNLFQKQFSPIPIKKEKEKEKRVIQKQTLPVNFQKNGKTNAS